jgi:hypothetical protein
MFKWITDKPFEFFSVVGHIASLAALLIVILDKIAAVEILSPQQLALRFVCLLAALGGVGTVIALMGMVVNSTYQSQFSTYIKIIAYYVEILFGLLLFYVGATAFFAAWYWNCWEPLRIFGVSDVCHQFPFSN